MPEQQPELPGFSQIDLDLLKINEGRRGQGLNELTIENLLPPQPDHRPTADELREAGRRQRPVTEELAEMRRRLPMMGPRTENIRVN